MVAGTHGKRIISRNDGWVNVVGGLKNGRKRRDESKTLFRRENGDRNGDGSCHGSAKDGRGKEGEREVEN